MHLLQQNKSLPLLVYLNHRPSLHISFIIASLLLGLLIVVFSKDVCMGGVVMVLWAVQMRDFDRLPARRFIYPVFKLVIKLKICWSFVDAFKELFFFNVVAWCMSLCNCVKLNWSSWNNSSIAINIVRDLLPQIVLNSLQYLCIDASLRPSLGCVNVNFTLSNYINSLFSWRLIEQLSWREHDIA